MARIAGVNIPVNKKLPFALTYIYGVGLTTAFSVCEKSSVDPQKRVKELTGDEIIKLRDVIGKECVVEGELRRAVSEKVSLLIDIKSYRGSRHIKKLPARGQRTRTNARTRKFGKRVAIPGKKKATK